MIFSFSCSLNEYYLELNEIIRSLNFFICLVLGQPFILDVDEAGESFEIEGENVTLSCSNDDNADLVELFMWLDSEGVSLVEPDIVRPLDLTLANVTRDQSGVYICAVSVGEVSLSVNTTLIVQCK